jgi:hypothetical protein
MSVRKEFMTGEVAVRAGYDMNIIDVRNIVTRMITGIAFREESLLQSRSPCRRDFFIA